MFFVWFGVWLRAFGMPLIWIEIIDHAQAGINECICKGQIKSASGQAKANKVENDDQGWTSIAGAVRGLTRICNHARPCVCFILKVCMLQTAICAAFLPQSVAVD